jgi:hypothetical protein
VRRSPSKARLFKLLGQQESQKQIDQYPAIVQFDGDSEDPPQSKGSSNENSQDIMAFDSGGGLTLLAVALPSL